MPFHTLPPYTPRCTDRNDRREVEGQQAAANTMRSNRERHAGKARTNKPILVIRNTVAVRLFNFLPHRNFRERIGYVRRMKGRIVMQGSASSDKPNERAGISAGTILEKSRDFREGRSQGGYVDGARGKRGPKANKERDGNRVSGANRWRGKEQTVNKGERGNNEPRKGA